MKKILSRVVRAARLHLSTTSMPESARAQADLDKRGLPEDQPDPAAVMAAAMDWLCRAQDHSASDDGGVSRDFSLVAGWAPSYPETTGYIVPTFLDRAEATGETRLRDRAARMLAWLRSIQLPGGGFQGGTIHARPVVPVVFNTGQILLGLAAGERTFGDCSVALRRAADWLVEIQDADGSWRKFQSPFAIAGEKTYDTHAAWGLLEAERVVTGRGYGDAALAHIRWALGHQHDNGWLGRCCLNDFSSPLTHTLGYALRGVIEGYRFSRDPAFLAAAARLADGMLGALAANGHLPGRLTADWSAAAGWACLTGTVQVAHCWLMLYEYTGDERYRRAAAAANAYVRRTVSLDGPADVRGAVRGSFPIDGAYLSYAYPSWAAKFLIDSLALEARLAGGSKATAAA